MKTFISWALVVLAFILLCVGTMPDYVVAVVFVLIALFLRMGQVWQILEDTYDFHKAAHNEAMGGVADLKIAYPPPKCTHPELVDQMGKTFCKACGEEVVGDR